MTCRLVVKAEGAFEIETSNDTHRGAFTGRDLQRQNLVPGFDCLIFAFQY